MKKRGLEFNGRGPAKLCCLALTVQRAGAPIAIADFDNVVFIFPSYPVIIYTIYNNGSIYELMVIPLAISLVHCCGSFAEQPPSIFYPGPSISQAGGGD